jgi:putative Mg2+ transporter-C (MgtC) family protein
MEHEYITSSIRLLLAVLAGGLIGLERSIHGRPAGFRTHTLVCTASSLLMLLATFQWHLIAGAPMETVRVDPTRMAQGIMTGIGFLGAGVIIKERMKIRGLTTAASLWLTASIGVVIGMGLYFAAFLATLLALGVLVFFRWIEASIPTLQTAQLSVRFISHDNMTEDDLRQLIKDHGMDCSNFNYGLENEGKVFMYQMNVSTHDAANYKKLSESLTAMDRAIEFSITPTGD